METEQQPLRQDPAFSIDPSQLYNLSVGYTLALDAANRWQEPPTAAESEELEEYSLGSGWDQDTQDESTRHHPAITTKPSVSSNQTKNKFVHFAGTNLFG